MIPLAAEAEAATTAPVMPAAAVQTMRLVTRVVAEAQTTKWAMCGVKMTSQATYAGVAAPMTL